VCAGGSFTIKCEVGDGKQAQGLSHTGQQRRNISRTAALGSRNQAQRRRLSSQNVGPMAGSVRRTGPSGGRHQKQERRVFRMGSSGRPNVQRTCPPPGGGQWSTPSAALCRPPPRQPAAPRGSSSAGTCRCRGHQERSSRCTQLRFEPQSRRYFPCVGPNPTAGERQSGAWPKGRWHQHLHGALVSCRTMLAQRTLRRQTGRMKGTPAQAGVPASGRSLPPPWSSGLPSATWPRRCRQTAAATWKRTSLLITSCRSARLAPMQWNIGNMLSQRTHSEDSQSTEGCTEGCTEGNCCCHLPQMLLQAPPGPRTPRAT